MGDRGRDPGPGRVVSPRDRWKHHPSPAAPVRSRSQTSRRIGWTLATVAAMLGLGVIAFWDILFARQAAVVWLSIDDYDRDLLLAPLPFADEDFAGIKDAVAGRLSPLLEGRSPRALGLSTASTLQSEIRPTLAGLRLGRRDSLVAVIRGQTLVATVGQDEEPKACLLASDTKLAETAPTNLLACRDLFSALASSPARTTLVVLDMGDLRWNPRFGVVAGLVPAALDEELKEPAAGGECWVLGSHDIQEFSGVSLPARRGIFLRAVELALEGRADDREWGGDGDGAVELDELARFVSRWTSEWARQENGGQQNGGDHGQHPVVWKLGKGRVSVDDVPTGIWLVAAGKPVAQPGQPPTQSEPQASPEQQPPNTTAGQKPPEPSSGSENPAGTEPGQIDSPRDLWSWIDLICPATADRQEPCPDDYAPHLWRKIVAVAGLVAATPPGATPFAAKSMKLKKALEADLSRFASSPKSGQFDNSTPVGRLAKSRLAAERSYFRAWQKGDSAEASAIATRNRAFRLAAAVVDYCGTAAGSEFARPLPDFVRRLLEKLAELQQRLVEAGGRADAESDAELEVLARDVERREKKLQDEVDKRVKALIEAASDDANPPPSTDIRWLLASPLPTSDQRRRLGESLANHRPQDDTANEPVGKERQGSSDLGRARRSLAMPASPQLSSVSGQTPVRVPPRWDGIENQVEHQVQLFRQMLDVFMDQAAAVPSGSAETLTADAAVAAGRAFASELAALPGEVNRRLRRAGDAADFNHSAVSDACLRLVDPRDASRVDSRAIGVPPAIRTATPPPLVIDASDDPLEAGQSRRVTITAAAGVAEHRETSVQLDFDPELIRVRSLRSHQGPPLRPGDRVELRGRSIELWIEPVRAVPLGAADTQANLVAEWLLDGRRPRAEHAFVLPLNERLKVFVRGQPGTVEDGAEAEGGWRSQEIDPVVVQHGGSEEAGGVAGKLPGFHFHPFGGQNTTWDLEVANLTGEPREIDVEILSFDLPQGSKKVDWTGLQTSLTRGRRLPPSCQVVWRSSPVVLPKDSARVPIHAVEPEALPPAPGGAAAEEQPERAVVGSSLAIVLRDRAAAENQPPATATDQATAAAPVARPTERRRTWCVPLTLSPRRPREFLRAEAFWSTEDRSIRVVVKPSAEVPDSLPRGDIEVWASPLQAGDRLPLRLKKNQASLVQATPERSREAVLEAVWNGADEEPATLEIEVDGWPRAFVFQVDCRPAKDGIRQRPQQDWRQVVFVKPDKDLRPYRLDEEIPLELAVDVPADLMQPGVVELGVREDDPRKNRVGENSRVIWAADSDRQVVFSLASPAPRGTFAVHTCVSDWHWPLAVRTLGFSDLDIVLEARLKLRDTGSSKRQGPEERAERRVVIDGEPPTVRVARQRWLIERAADASIEVEYEDGDPTGVSAGGRRQGASGVQWIEWRIDANGAGQPAEWNKVRASGSQVLLNIVTKDLSAGTHELEIRAIDGVGLESRSSTCTLEIRDQATGSDKP